MWILRLSFVLRVLTHAVTFEARIADGGVELPIFRVLESQSLESACANYESILGRSIGCVALLLKHYIAATGLERPVMANNSTTRVRSHHDRIPSSPNAFECMAGLNEPEYRARRANLLRRCGPTCDTSSFTPQIVSGEQTLPEALDDFVIYDFLALGFLSCLC